MMPHGDIESSPIGRQTCDRVAHWFNILFVRHPVSRPDADVSRPESTNDGDASACSQGRTQPTEEWLAEWIWPPI
jgi:hypothetical protein